MHVVTVLAAARNDSMESIVLRGVNWIILEKVERERCFKRKLGDDYLHTLMSALPRYTHTRRDGLTSEDWSCIKLRSTNHGERLAALS